MLDIHALQVFFEASKTGSFTAAARTLNMTQPAVSMQIKTLEDYLQVQLFERQGRSIHLSKAGQAFVPLARQIIEMTIKAEKMIRGANSAVMGNLTIGTSVPSANRVLVHLLARFQKLYPNVRISLPLVSQEELLDKLTSGIYDFGVLNVVGRCEQVTCMPFFDDRIVLVAPTMPAFGLEREIEPAELLNQHFVCQDHHSACRYAVGDALKPYDIDINEFDIRMEIGSHSAIIAAVEHGVGVSFISLLEAAPALAQGQIRIVDVRGVRLNTHVHMAASKAHITTPVGIKFQAFMEHPQTIAHTRLLTQGAIPDVQSA
ncbi:MAG: LysR family transcriptional regulator [Anaerolineaceae bacterium]|nr:LysR family transcriptional regulator [Anaerolineaceae bacterium]